jgi:hypothetical protein
MLVHCEAALIRPRGRRPAAAAEEGEAHAPSELIHTKPDAAAGQCRMVSIRADAATSAWAVGFTRNWQLSAIECRQEVGGNEKSSVEQGVEAEYRAIDLRKGQ